MLILARWRGGVEGVVASQYIAGGVLAAIPYCQHKAVVNLTTQPSTDPNSLYANQSGWRRERDGRLDVG